MLNPMKQELLCVRGNCDTEVDQMVLEFPILADYCFLEIDGRTIFASHGHHHNPKNPPMLKKGDILLNGHTHIPANEDMGDFIYMNPGSVSIPKEGSAHGYMIFTFTGTASYFLFRGCRMPYQLNGNCVTVVTAEGYSNQLSLADFQGF